MNAVPREEYLTVDNSSVPVSTHLQASMIFGVVHLSQMSTSPPDFMATIGVVHALDWMTYFYFTVSQYLTAQPGIVGCTHTKVINNAATWTACHSLTRVGSGNLTHLSGIHRIGMSYLKWFHLSNGRASRVPLERLKPRQNKPSLKQDSNISA